MRTVPQLTLRAAREMLGLTQHQLADRAGVKRSAIDDIERGRSTRPAYVTVMCIVRALKEAGLNGISAEDVFPIDADHEARAAS